jgi:hypothetical protein
MTITRTLTTDPGFTQWGCTILDYLTKEEINNVVLNVASSFFKELLHNSTAYPQLQQNNPTKLW